MKKWMMILGVFVILLGAGLAVGCGKDSDEPEVGSIPLTVSEPLDETTVYVSELVVKGHSNPDAVVIVNYLLYFFFA